MKGVYEELKPHIGHKFVCVTYADGENIALECMDCMAVVVDADREPEEVVKEGHNLLLDLDLNYWSDDAFGPPRNAVVSSDTLDALYDGELQATDLKRGPISELGNYMDDEAWEGWQPGHREPFERLLDLEADLERGEERLRAGQKALMDKEQEEDEA